MDRCVFFALCVLLCAPDSYGAVNKLAGKRMYENVKPVKKNDNYINVEFDCNLLTSPEPPNSVHQLMPSDVKVVGALGDSLTAANGAKAETLPGVAIQYRGVAALIGGDENLDTVSTLPNLTDKCCLWRSPCSALVTLLGIGDVVWLEKSIDKNRKYNEKIYGFSTGTGSYDEPNSKFNVAIPGAKSKGMPEQAQYLVEHVLNDLNVDYENDWKLVSIFIGGNDLCAWCKDKEQYAPDQYVANIEKAITVLQQMPRTFVNIVGVLNVYLVGNISGPTCDIFHQAVCSCGMGEDEKIAELKAITKEYQRLLEESITSGKFDNREDFTVVYQPFFHETDLPALPDGTVDKSYFSPDCFHFSEKGQGAQAIALWNNMIQPVGEKDISWDMGEIRCPSKESPYLFTNVNSKPMFGNFYMPGRIDIENPRESVPTSVIVFSVIGGTIFILVVITLGVRYTRRRKSNLPEKQSLLENQFS